MLVLGAGFGGLELATVLSDEFGDDLDLTLIDSSDNFVFGYSKLDVMFGHAAPDSVRMFYRDIAKPGVRFVQQTITAVDPVARRVTTDSDTYDADILVIALGADYDLDATPGLAELGAEFYSVEGAERMAARVDAISGGRAVIGVCGTPFKCPPAPSETALMLHDHLTRRGIRADCDITLLFPLGAPVPPSPDTSRALVSAFKERGIAFLPGRVITSLDADRKVANVAGGEEVPFDVFLGVPKHRVPPALAGIGLAGDGFIPVNPQTMATQFPNVYAIGDVASVGVPKAGMFAEDQGRVAAAGISAAIRGSGDAPGYDGRASCYIEFGHGLVGRVDVDFFSGPSPSGTFAEPSAALADEKRRFGATRRARWFGVS